MPLNWFLFKRITRGLWFLPALFSVFAVLVLAAAYFSTIFFADPIKSGNLPITVSQEAVKGILSIVAASMLTVSVFALSTLVNLLANASQSGSPRAVPLIVEDRRAQTSISVFIGAFLFSIVGIIGLSGEIYSTSGRLILFGATVVVVLAIVFALIRWIGQISVVGRVGETIDRVEKATKDALERLGPAALYGCCRSMSVTGSEFAVRAERVGFVQHFDRERLQEIAEEHNLNIHVVTRPGSYVDYATILAQAAGEASDDCLTSMRQAFLVGGQRTFDYDPGYGLTILAEIARRALSPAVNDPGTAIDVIFSQTRLLGDWARGAYGEQAESQFSRVSVEPVAPAELIAEAFGSISRDAGASLDVTLAMLRGLKTLANAAPSDFGKPAMQLAHDILARSELSMKLSQDIADVRAAVEEFGPAKAVPEVTDRKSLGSATVVL
ncbi:hypothetical protein MesoLjLa_65370 (plasmid) [Mesorhizobium sp. L-2-11]|nr:hypothetical protein MesoLjLa_65370 [Mesorhizobium sp. L-2-11]